MSFIVELLWFVLSVELLPVAEYTENRLLTSSAGTDGKIFDRDVALSLTVAKLAFVVL